MPELRVEFEVFCGTCGAGLCLNANTRKSRTRGVDQIVVDVCDDCVAKYVHRIKELEDQVEQLETENQAIRCNSH